MFTPLINGSILKNLGNQERYNIADRLVYHVNNKRIISIMVIPLIKSINGKRCFICVVSSKISSPLLFTPKSAPPAPGRLWLLPFRLCRSYAILNLLRLHLNKL